MIKKVSIVRPKGQKVRNKMKKFVNIKFVSMKSSCRLIVRVHEKFVLSCK
jgi:diaminopimelate epimerase